MLPCSWRKVKSLHYPALTKPIERIERHLCHCFTGLTRVAVLLSLPPPSVSGVGSSQVRHT